MGGYPRQVESISATLNGTPVKVKRYSDPIKLDWIAFCLELTDSVDPGIVQVT